MYNVIFSGLHVGGVGLSSGEFWANVAVGAGSLILEGYLFSVVACYYLNERARSNKARANY